MNPAQIKKQEKEEKEKLIKNLIEIRNTNESITIDITEEIFNYYK